MVPFLLQTHSTQCWCKDALRRVLTAPPLLPRSCKSAAHRGADTCAATASPTPTLAQFICLLHISHGTDGTMPLSTGPGPLPSDHVDAMPPTPHGVAGATTWGPRKAGHRSQGLCYSRPGYVALGHVAALNVSRLSCCEATAGPACSKPAHPPLRSHDRVACRPYTTGACAQPSRWLSVDLREPAQSSSPGLSACIAA